MIHLAACLVLSLLPTVESGAPPMVSTVSTKAAFTMEKCLMPELPTVFLFYQTNSSAEKAIAAGLQTRAEKEKRFGLRLIAVKGLDVLACRDYGVSESPTLMVLDRFGRLLVRTSKVEELQAALDKTVGMARIKWVDEKDPAAATAYKSMGGGKRPVAGILKTMSLRPELMEGVNRIAGMAHFSNGFLPRKTKEMIATYVSAINHCKF